MSSELIFALDAAYAAGRSTLAHFGTPFEVEFKADHSPVTIADRTAESLIRAAIAAKFPTDAILGEEEGESGSSSRRWVIDPIDGTRSFVAGVPLYATLLSLELEGVPQLGVVYFPALEEMFYAERGQGAFRNGRAIRVAPVAQLEAATVLTGNPKHFLDEPLRDAYDTVIRRAQVARNWGDAYGHALVACGDAHAMLDGIVAHYDVSSIKVLIEEAGGRFSEINGGSGLGPSALSTNGMLHEEILGLFNL